MNVRRLICAVWVCSAGCKAPEAGPDAGGQDVAGVTGGALVYSGDRTHSPIDELTVKRLKEIVARGSGEPSVFSKVGDSISTNSSGVAGGNFLNCFAGPLEGEIPWEINVRLGPFSGLARTITFFQTPKFGTDDSWTRPSRATQVGRTAGWAIRGMPSPLELELNEARPRYAIVMFGSNDIGSVTEDGLAAAAEVYERAMRSITDQLLAKGVIPMLTTMPVDRDFIRFTPVYSGVVRAIAQGRQIPLIDYQKELLAIGPPHGLRSDGVHPSCEDYQTCCWFDATSLSKHGYNIRNLITLQALDRLHQVMDLDVPALDPDARHVSGDGSPASPFLVSLPYGELRDLRESPTTVSGESSCAGVPVVAGPQNLYKLVLTRPTKVRALVLDGFLGHQRVSLLSGPSLSSCVATNERLIQTTLEAGTWYFAVNATPDGPGSEYNFSVTECREGDPDC